MSTLSAPLGATADPTAPPRTPAPPPTAQPDNTAPDPAKHAIFGVGVSAVGPDEAFDAIVRWASQRRAATVDFMPVHGLMEAAGDPDHRRRMNDFDLVCPDGQPVRWALNALHNTHIRYRTYGPHMMLRLCHAAAQRGLPIYLYGGRPEVLDTLRTRLTEQCPGLVITGAESPPFRPLSPAERDAAVDRINASGAALLFIGLGCPRQEVFAHDLRHRIRAVQLCVGAAFDFHAGAVAMAPPWMQKRGLEWLFRLTQEPGRLWKRYLVTNTAFVVRFALALAASPFRRGTASDPLSPRERAAASARAGEGELPVAPPAEAPRS